MGTVTLKNGSEASVNLVCTTTMMLDTMFKNKPMIAYELIMLARDRNHSLECGKPEGIDAGFLDMNGHMHPCIRDILVSAVTGDELNMVLGNPVVN